MGDRGKGETKLEEAREMGHGMVGWDKLFKDKIERLLTKALFYK